MTDTAGTTGPSATPTTPALTTPTTDADVGVIDFDKGVFQAEVDAIHDRHNRIHEPAASSTGGVADGRAAKANPEIIDGTITAPTTQLGLTGIALSGGGIRSASFCLGVLQGLQSKNVVNHMDYLST